MRPRGTFMPLVQRFFEHDPAAAALTLETMSHDEAVRVLSALPSPLAAIALRNLNVAAAAALIRDLPLEAFRDVVAKLDPQQTAAMFTTLPGDKQGEFLERIPEETRKSVGELLTFPENSAGRIMTTEFLAFHPDVKVKDAVRRIRSLVRRNAPASYVYVVEADDSLVGVINMRDLVITPGSTPLRDIMRTDLVSFNAFTDREEIANVLALRRYFAAPVVDMQGRMLGVVKTDQLLSHVQDEATEDIQKIFGAGAEERAFSPIRLSLRTRLPWLHVNLATAFMAASVVALFEDLIARITILAVFLPVVAGQGGNAGAQSLAVVMRGLVMREIPRERSWHLIFKESRIGIMNGLVIGFVTGIVVWAWHGNPYVGIVIALAMIANLLAAGFSGAAIPLAMRSLGLDPAQSSSIVLTTITDVVGFFSFLGFAMVFQSLLV